MSSHNHISRKRLLGCIGALALYSGAAQAALVVNFDEFGNGTIQGAAGTVPLPSLGNIVDPVDPGNGLMPLAYDLSAFGGAVFTPGDVDVVESDGTHSDLLRFTPMTTANPKQQLLIYSDLPEPGEFPVPPADVGIPVFRQLNNIALPESGPEAGPNGLFGYIPNPNDPGFAPTPPGPITYNFLSDGAVPEPASVGLLMVGGAYALLARRRR